jgi:hypothetical protein
MSNPLHMADCIAIEGLWHVRGMLVRIIDVVVGGSPSDVQAAVIQHSS